MYAAHTLSPWHSTPSATPNALVCGLRSLPRDAWARGSGRGQEERWSTLVAAWEQGHGGAGGKVLTLSCWSHTLYGNTATV
ncbi:hypothetical protein FA95DRAFT_1037137 [Auriscalpium vulgare]|uniref:Uncharacterized protein n=1 Tax=Auriscalpium vulgare TaxID=40419 RepID=A0ACB8RX80_9AGAM|nr:hypothetical protein FA95DRAFT_1037137 [Auriscalpium vulgare]